MKSGGFTMAELTVTLSIASIMILGYYIGYAIYKA
ncbi:prepilin-type N-terminal cleavage/methylation domain-containing protein [Mesobacillus subterraneus]